MSQCTCLNHVLGSKTSWLSITFAKFVYVIALMILIISHESNIEFRCNQRYLTPNFLNSPTLCYKKPLLCPLGLHLFARVGCILGSFMQLNVQFVPINQSIKVDCIGFVTLGWSCQRSSVHKFGTCCTSLYSIYSRWCCTIGNNVFPMTSHDFGMQRATQSHIFGIQLTSSCSYQQLTDKEHYFLLLMKTNILTPC